MMKRQYIARLEAHLEQLIEGTFAGLFGKRIHAQDVALQLARAMEDGLRAGSDGDPRPVAPDQYAIHLYPDAQTHLLQKHPDLAQTLAEHMRQMATQAGYRLYEPPRVSILADSSLDTGGLVVTAEHAHTTLRRTVAMERVDPAAAQGPPNARLLIAGKRTISLQAAVINIGRHVENDIILDNPQVSRFHLQLRLRFGVYLLFDVQSQGGTWVNGARVAEHLLQSGDVIQVGQTQMVYLDDSPSEVPGERTEAFRPIDG